MNNNLDGSDICDRIIRPAMEKAGWSGIDQIYRAYPLRAGRIVVYGDKARRDKSTELRADYVLFHKANIPLAVVQASRHTVGAGLPQAIDCARLLDVPFCFAGNGDGFVLHDSTCADAVREYWLSLDEFPSPAELWNRYCSSKGWSPKVCQVVASDYALSKTPRYYQLNAINRTVEAIANGQNRALLVMAAGTGKTYTAFQIIWRLWKSDSKKRILFLTSSNTLINQTMGNDFRPFKGAMAKLSPDAKGVERVEKSNKMLPDEYRSEARKTIKRVNKSYEIYLALCRVTIGPGEKRNDLYKQFPPDFFDLIVVDECHYGNTVENAAWNDILSYFAGATHVGFSATPIEAKGAAGTDYGTDDGTDYFGAPIYTYSFRQGIEDGYLAPYKVIRVNLDHDDTSTRHTTTGLNDRHDALTENNVHPVGIPYEPEPAPGQRDQVVAAKITEYLKATDRYAKTIVYCENTDHAARMCQALAEANADLCAIEPDYVAHITGDNADGKRELENFAYSEKIYPVIITSARLLEQGIDAATCKLIVLDQNIQSMTQFKQIIGQGIRLREDLGKSWFTIIDFRRATEIFADKDFDSDPVQVYEPQAGEPMKPPDSIDPLEPPGKTPDTPTDQNLRDDTRSKLQKRFDSPARFLQTWQQAESKTTLLRELETQGMQFQALATDTGLQDLDPLDLLLHVAYDQPTLTRRERVARVKKRRFFAYYNPLARKVLQTLLEKYIDEGIITIENNEVLKLQSFTKLGSPVELVRSFGGRPQYLAALQALAYELYSPN